MPSAKASLQPPISHAEASDDSSDDSDFAGSLSSSSSDSEAGGKSLKRKSRYEDVDSGDEKVMAEGERKRKKRSKKDAAEVEEGVGMRLRRRKDGRDGEQGKKSTLDGEGATIDVDKLWAQMNSTDEPAKRPEGGQNSSQPLEKAADSCTADSRDHHTDKGTGNAHIANPTSANEETITIKRTYAFAGEMITEEKVVLKSSAEARLYLQSQQTKSDLISNPGIKPPLRRPKKRASIFEPSPEGVGHAPTHFNANKVKLNTIEKSKLDWAGYVDQEGMKEELDGAEKSKDGYLGKREFLDRVGAKRDHELMSAKKR